MNARVIGLSQFTASVSLWGVPMDCEYEYEEGEAPIYWPTDNAHPGSPSELTMLSCKVGGVNIMEMLSAKQQERIEEKLLEQHEGH
jgi:hypothetical protein